MILWILYGLLAFMMLAMIRWSVAIPVLVVLGVVVAGAA